MKRYIVDTNVPIVANGRPNTKDIKKPSICCRMSAVKFLQRALSSGKILLDLAGDIEAEYRTHLNAKGQPGVGDRFYQEVLRSAPRRVERVELPKREDDEYADLPEALIVENFDRSDRKFAALAKRENAPVVNATDSDWLHHRMTLSANGIKVDFLCGCNSSEWFTEG